MVLVRHALSVFPIPDGPDETHRPLTAEGVRQAQNLVAESTLLAPAVVWSSPYRRAIQTVEPCATHLGLPVLVSSRLREWDSGLEPTPDYLRHYERSWSDPDLARPNGESLAQLTRRSVSALASLARGAPGATVIVGSHGTFISWALVGFGVDVDFSFTRAMPMPAAYHLHLTDHGASVTGPGLGREQPLGRGASGVEFEDVGGGPTISGALGGKHADDHGGRDSDR